jgi:hypothetical protein
MFGCAYCMMQQGSHKRTVKQWRAEQVSQISLRPNTVLLLLLRKVKRTAVLAQRLLLLHEHVFALIVLQRHAHLPHRLVPHSSVISTQSTSNGVCNADINAVVYAAATACRRCCQR